MRLKNHRRKVVFYQGHNMGLLDKQEYVHSLLKVSIKGGETYALDITSAQYGYHDPISPWPDFLRDRVATFRCSEPFGTWRSKASIHQPLTIQAAIEKHHKRATAFMNNDIRDWSIGNQMTLKELLCLPEDSFEKKKNELLATIDTGLVKVLDYLGKSIILTTADPSGG